jgi:hypothetical protein
MFLECRARPVRTFNNLSAICEPSISSISHNPIGLHGLLRGSLYFFWYLWTLTYRVEEIFMGMWNTRIIVLTSRSWSCVWSSKYKCHGARLQTAITSTLLGGTGRQSLPRGPTGACLQVVSVTIQIHINIRKRNSVFYFSIISTLHHFIFLSRRPDDGPGGRNMLWEGNEMM